ncbi:MAG: RagB/SusD family nutrient uptake outer membrane protein, partial [Bacteroidota bacterium]
MRSVNYFIGFVLMASLFSCDEFLDRQPLDQITAENFYRTEDEMELAVMAVYEPIQNIEWLGKGWHITEIPSDNTQPGGTDPDFTPMDEFTVNADNGTIANFWAIRYRCINLANVVIEKAPQAEISAQKAEEFIQEAKFLRALAYFDLVRIYGGVPLVINAPSNDQDLLLPRASVEEVYDLIAADLTHAAEGLPISRSGSAVGRATKGAALALHAKVELTRRDFRAAADLATAVMDLGVYRLMEDYGENWELSTADNNAESVFQAQFAGCGPFGTGNPQQAFFAPGGEGITRDRDGWGSQVPTGPGTNTPGTTMMSAFEPGDLRRYHTMMEPNNYYPTINASDGGYTYPSNGASRVNANIKKYVVGAGSNICFMSTPQNGHIIRYADVLLTLAEAQVELGSGVTVNEDALAAFNQIRTRAGLEEVTSIDRESVLAERRVEFAFEG